MARLEIKRTYAHRKFGDIGEVTLFAPGTTYELNGATLPRESVEYLLTFALQSLQDAYAGAKTADEAKGAWAKKRDKLISGEIGTRGTGSGLGAVESEIVSELRPYVKGKVKGYKEMSPADRDKAIWAKFGKLDEDKQTVLRERAEIRIEERKAAADAMAELVGDVDLDDESEDDSDE